MQDAMLCFGSTKADKINTKSHNEETFMKLQHIFLALVLAFSITACSNDPTPAPTVTEQELNGQEYLIRENFKTDEETWKTTDERVLLKGCEDWKKRNPNADC